jgi:hypothetical protein
LFSASLHVSEPHKKVLKPCRWCTDTEKCQSKLI